MKDNEILIAKTSSYGTWEIDNGLGLYTAQEQYPNGRVGKLHFSHTSLANLKKHLNYFFEEKLSWKKSLKT